MKKGGIDLDQATFQHTSRKVEVFPQGRSIDAKNRFSISDEKGLALVFAIRWKGKKTPPGDGGVKLRSHTVTTEELQISIP